MVLNQLDPIDRASQIMENSMEREIGMHGGDKKHKI
jgi:hypothetical protein